MATSTPDSVPHGRAHLSEAVVDPGTLVSSNSDFWEVDRNGRVIQHFQLILNQHPQIVEGTVVLFKPRPFVVVEVFNVLYHLKQKQNPA